jgi:hypothetical protein
MPPQHGRSVPASSHLCGLDWTPASLSFAASPFSPAFSIVTVSFYKNYFIKSTLAPAHNLPGSMTASRAARLEDLYRNPVGHDRIVMAAAVRHRVNPLSPEAYLKRRHP